jgi:hypothetical protein
MTDAVACVGFLFHLQKEEQELVKKEEMYVAAY